MGTGFSKEEVMGEELAQILLPWLLSEVSSQEQTLECSKILPLYAYHFYSYLTSSHIWAGDHAVCAPCSPSLAD